MQFSLENYLNEIKKDLSTDHRWDLKWLVENLPETPDGQQISLLKEQVKRLKQDEPLAYILGYMPFYNCKIYLNKNTLIPRPETELLADTIFKKWKNKADGNTRILDLCSGSGCIAVALQKALNCVTDAVDISPACCTVIRENAKRNGVKINVIQSDMFAGVKQKYDLIVSNPPYIPSIEINGLQKSVKDYEPHSALDGGSDGLDFYRQIAVQAPAFLKDDGELALEIGCNQAESVKELLADGWTDIEIKKDYSNLNRFVFAKKK